MPRNGDEPERLLVLDENLTVVAPSNRPPRARRFRRRLRGPPAIAPQLELAPAPPPADSLMRTRRLVLAALRVWELRHGIHDSF